MKLSRRLISIAAVALLAPAGAVAASAPASAATAADCPANHLCLYNGKNVGGTMIFNGNGTTLFNNGGYFDSALLRSGAATVSSINKTTGKFCTYDASGRLNNILAPGTGGNVAANNVRWVKFCW